MRTRGFTLFELVVVLAIIGTFTLLVLPSFRISETGERGRFAELSGFLEKARNQAMRSGTPILVSFSGDRGEVGLFPLTGGTPAEKPTEELTGQPPFRVERAIGTLAETRILLLPDGTTEPFSILAENAEAESPRLLFTGSPAPGRVFP